MMPQSGQSRFGWRVYAVVLGCLLVIMYATVMTLSFRPIYIADLSITGVAYTGLLGYAFQRKLGTSLFWKVLCVAFVAWEIFFNFVISPQSLKEVGAPLVAICMLVVLGPEYVALYRYGYRSPEIWASQ